MVGLMNRTIKEVTVKRRHCGSHDQLQLRAQAQETITSSK